MFFVKKFMQIILKFCNFAHMKRIETLKKHLKPGKVYRRADLQKWSASVDRHLQSLVKDGTLEKLSGGLYYVPKQSAFGKTPANEQDLVKSFLKDARFVIMSPNDYNTLQVGTTQLYNERRVYNYKRNGIFKLGNRTFRFIRKPYVPSEVTKEFLLVDLANNAKYLAEDQPHLMEKVKHRVTEMNSPRLKRLAHDFGTVGTRKLFTSLLD
jgi:hypothetical protein